MQRQGDLLIIKINELPKEVKKLKTLIVAYGEITGHKHRLTRDSTEVLEPIKVDIKFPIKFLNIVENDTLVHEEHKTVELEKGFYKIIYQREFDLIEGYRQVID